MGGRGSSSYSSGGVHTDTKSGKALIGAAGGATMVIPNSSKDLQTKYSRAGFNEIYGGDDVQNSVLGTYAAHLRKLDKRFGAIGGSEQPNVIVTNAKGSSAIAAVGFSPSNPAEQTLYLNSNYLGKISKATATTKKATESGWAAKNSGTLQARAYYAITHEYGHMLHNQMFAEARKNGYTGTRNEFVKKCNEEVLAIAKSRYGVKHATKVSDYGNTNGRERFAETFASSQLGGKTAMAKAMRAWLKEQGF